MEEKVNTRESALTSISTGLLIFDQFITPITIPFTEIFILGFISNFLAFRNTVKIIVVSGVFGLIRYGIQYGIFVSIGIYIGHITGSFLFLPFGHYLFNKFNLRKRIGK